jgi:hypothetical protein
MAETEAVLMSEFSVTNWVVGKAPDKLATQEHNSFKNICKPLAPLPQPRTYAQTAPACWPPKEPGTLRPSP